MNSSFLEYLERLEIFAFFSGFPLIFTIMVVVAGNQKEKTNFKNRIVSLLPYSYALTGTLFAAFQIKNLYPDFSLEHIQLSILQPYLKIWALISLLFWIPLFSKRIYFCLLHSLVFFFFFAKELYLQATQSDTDNPIGRNEMTVYTDSLILNISTLVITLLIFYIIYKMNRQNKTASGL